MCLLRYKYTRAVAAFSLRFGRPARPLRARLLDVTEMNGICEQWYDATVGPPCRPAAALTIGMMATWLSTIVAVLVIVAKGLLGSKAKRA